MHSFHTVRYASSVDKINDTVTEHFAVNAQVFMSGKERQYSVRNTSDSELQRRSIADQIFCYIFPYFLLILGGRFDCMSWQGLMEFSCEIQMTFVHQSITESSWQVFVHLSCKNFILKQFPSPNLCFILINIFQLVFSYRRFSSILLMPIARNRHLYPTNNILGCPAVLLGLTQYQVSCNHSRRSLVSRSRILVCNRQFQHSLQPSRYLRWKSWWTWSALNTKYHSFLLKKKFRIQEKHFVLIFFQILVSRL